ncbi:MAG: flagellar export chaperone FliS [Solirubrobacteraceae bacterium]
MTVKSMGNVAASPQAYMRGSIRAAGPAQLVVILYDGARRFLRQAIAALEAGDIERAHVTLRHGETIIAHLNGTLDLDQGEVAVHLRQLYEFCLRHLNAARMAKDPAMIAQVSDMLGELREAWAQVAAEAPDG